MTDDAQHVGSPEDTLQIMLDKLATEDVVCVDVETSGLDWRHNFICGYVLSFGPDKQDSYYLPVRHAGFANLGGVEGPRNATAWDERISDGERALLRALDRKDRLIFGHKLGFDLLFLARTGEFKFKPQCQDTMINAALLNEHQTYFNLENCARIAGVEAKKLTEITTYLATQFVEAQKDPDKAMGHFWRLSGDDPMAHEYARGDGVTTWQLRDWQNTKLAEEELLKVHGVESRLIRVLAKMSFRGIKADEKRLAEVITLVETEIKELLSKLPEGFNPKSPLQMIKYCTDNGHTDWPYTAPSKKHPRGQPSFPEAWLETHEPGQRIVEIRKLQTLLNSFLVPLRDRHIWRGRVHATFNQLKNDEFGTVTGRLSCSEPNLQQIHKRNKKLGRLVRSIFIPDDGLVWASADYKQCLAAGTQVMVPGGTKNIEDMEPGDWVYSYDNSRRLVLKRVLWAGQTGVRSLVRLHWSTNGRTRGHLDVTLDHPVRLLNGEYATAAEMAMTPHKGKTRGFPHWISTLALRRGIHKVKNYDVSYLYTTGRNRIKESRFVFEQVYGWSPEEVHHKDENSLNNSPDNLEGLSSSDHKKRHGPMYGMQHLTPEQRKERSMVATLALQAKFKLVNNHAITNIEPLPGEHPVYDITVEDTHNFIANEICVHNCEPVLLAYYSRSKVLLEGYRANPPIDAHQAVATAANIDRETGKRVNQTLITGGGKKVLVFKYKVDPREVDRVWSDYFKAMPEISKLQKESAKIFKQRGYIVSLLGRRARLNDDRAYTSVNRLLQCGNADVIKLKLVECDDYIEASGSSVALLNNIHDDLSFQFLEADRVHYEKCLSIMTDFGPGAVIELDVPLGVDPGEGSNWAIATYGEAK